MKETALDPCPVDTGSPLAIAAATAELAQADRLDGAGATLPRDHPAWQRDSCSVSARARAVLAHLSPLIVRVRTFWDHAVRTMVLGTGRLEVDPSGCYRLDRGARR